MKKFEKFDLVMQDCDSLVCKVSVVDPTARNFKSCWQ